MNNNDFNQEVRTFTVTTFDGIVITFTVNADYTLTSDFFKTRTPIRLIELKPNLLIRTVENSYMDFDIYGRMRDSKRQYVASIDIDYDLLVELIKHGAFYYSTDMAYLYGLEPEFAFDRLFNRQAFKHVKDKSKILALQKQGIFN